MNKTNAASRKIELLAPAGDFEKLEIAIHYGADALYLGGKSFSLRNFSGNFTLDELKQAVQLSHRQGIKVYVACNIYPRTHEQKEIEAYLKKLGEISPDAIIIADPGIFMTARDLFPQMPIHLSTQANTSNLNSVLFWEKLGVSRINIARELSLAEIKEITAKSNVEIEAFVHGAMCIAYSGRCLLSSYMTHRESNRGSCSHSCRWKYAVVEEQRPGQYIPVGEDDRGTYIFSSRDLCMIGHVNDMIESGITALKIEGRMKGINYLASVVKVYREAIDSYYENPNSYDIKEEWIEELSHIDHRGFCTGFYLGDPDQVAANFSGPKAVTEHRLLGKVEHIERTGMVHVDVRSKMLSGDTVEILKSNGPVELAVIEAIQDHNRKDASPAQPGSKVNMALSVTCESNDLIRKPTE